MTTTTLITGKWGMDNGSRAGNGWDKFVIKNLEMVAEEKEITRRVSYTTGALQAPDGLVFTVWASADGGKPAYWIGIVDSTAEESRIDGYAGCHLTGRFRILAQAEGDTYAPRLLGWWKDGCQAKAAESAARKAQGEGGTYTRAWQAAFARHLATQIARRGIKEPAPMVEA